MTNHPCCGNVTPMRAAAEPYIHWWTKPAITYRIEAVPNGLAEATYTQAIEEALSKWLQYIPLKVTKAGPEIVQPELNFRIQDTSYAGSRVWALSTVPDNSLGYTFTWVNSLMSWRYPSTEFGFLITHEIGHQLGLEHSTVYGAVMYPYYDGTTEPQDDDIARIQELYGVNPMPLPWTKVAGQGESFTLPAPATVRYGADSRWLEKALPAGTYTCDVPLFGSDPAYGTLKTCQVSGVAPPPPTPDPGTPATVDIVTSGNVTVTINGKPHS